jgi:ABC-type Fe3+-siderophore transport system permease subunit
MINLTCEIIYIYILINDDWSYANTFLTIITLVALVCLSNKIINVLLYTLEKSPQKNKKRITLFINISLILNSILALMYTFFIPLIIIFIFKSAKIDRRANNEEIAVTESQFRNPLEVYNV